MQKQKGHVPSARILVISAAILWLAVTLISISYALRDGAVFYIPELVLIMIMSVILLAWSASVHRFPHLVSKIGYLSILVSAMNLLALAITGGSAHSIIGIYPGINTPSSMNTSIVVPNVSFYMAYIATAIGIIGGLAIIKNKNRH